MKSLVLTLIFICSTIIPTESYARKKGKKRDKKPKVQKVQVYKLSSKKCKRKKKKPSKINGRTIFRDKSACISALTAKCNANPKKEMKGEKCKRKKHKKISGYKLSGKKCRKKRIKENKFAKNPKKYFKSESGCLAALKIKCEKKKNRELKNKRCVKKGQEKVPAYKLAGKKCKKKSIKKRKLDKAKTKSKPKFFETEAGCLVALEKKCTKKKNREFLKGKCQKKGQRKVTAWKIGRKRCKSKMIKQRKVDKHAKKDASKRKIFANQSECEDARIVRVKAKCEKKSKREFDEATGRCRRKKRTQEQKAELLNKAGNFAKTGGKAAFDFVKTKAGDNPMAGAGEDAFNQPTGDGGGNESVDSNIERAEYGKVRLENAAKREISKDPNSLQATFYRDAVQVGCEDWIGFEADGKKMKNRRKYYRNCTRKIDSYRKRNNMPTLNQEKRNSKRANKDRIDSLLLNP